MAELELLIMFCRALPVFTLALAFAEVVVWRVRAFALVDTVAFAVRLAKVLVRLAKVAFKLEVKLAVRLVARLVIEFKAVRMLLRATFAFTEAWALALRFAWLVLKIVCTCVISTQFPPLEYKSVQTLEELPAAVTLALTVKPRALSWAVVKQACWLP